MVKSATKTESTAYSQSQASLSTGLQGFGTVVIHEIEGIPFRRFNSLLQNELEWFEGQSDSRLTDIKKVLELAQKISVNEGIEEKEALIKVQDLENPENQHLLLKYADELNDINASSYTETHFKRDVALMMLNSRVPKKFIRENLETFSDTYDIEFNPENVQFTKDSVCKLPVATLNAIAEFTANEKSGWIEPESTGLQEEEATNLGK